MPSEGPTAARVLGVLERLQNRPAVSGPRLAAEVGVSERTVRRYVATLQEMGIPIEATRGAEGGYRLGQGYRIPPLMFTTDEAVVLVLALSAIRQTATDEQARSDVEDTAGERAIRKLARVLPRDIAGRVAAVQAAISTPDDLETMPRRMPHLAVLVPLAEAVVARRQCRMVHRPEQGEVTTRDINPYGVVALGGGWYVHGWCHLRRARRTFRIDRIQRLWVLDRQFSAPQRLDLVAAVERSIALSWKEWPVTLLVHGPVEAVREWIPRRLGLVQAEDPTTTRLVSSTRNLDYFVLRISDMPYDITVLEPDELRVAFGRTAERMAAVARR